MMNNEADIRFTFHRKHTIAMRAKDTFDFASKGFLAVQPQIKKFGSQENMPITSLDKKPPRSSKGKMIASIKQNNVSIIKSIFIDANI